jgi:hypothetical protein
LIKFRQLFLVFTLSSLLVSYAWAQSNLTQISDTVSNPDGSPFNGTVVITWTGSGTSTGSAPAPYGTSAKIYNGVLSVSLVPSVTASSSAFYLATFNSKDGRLSWVETWQVGVSSAPLTLSQVRSNISGATGSSGAGTISIGQVTGLSSYLNAISNSLNTMTATVGGFNSSISGLTSSVANLTNIVNGLASTPSASSNTPTFFDGEIPQGLINGTNPVFNLINPPNPASSLSLFRNGVLQKAGSDFSLSGATITFFTASTPQLGDLVQASYRTGTAGQSSFVDNQTPTGTVNGVNLIFKLGSAPSPASSLRLYKNGILLMQSADYTVSGSTITFLSTGSAPTLGDSLVSFYRITN